MKQPMFDFQIEDVRRYNECAYYGHCGPIWFVEFRDFTSIVVLYNSPSDLNFEGRMVGNFIMEQELL